MVRTATRRAASGRGAAGAAGEGASERVPYHRRMRRLAGGLVVMRRDSFDAPVR